MARITFLGTGAMGSRMARRLAAAGHELTLWNRTASTAQALAAELGAAASTDPVIAVADADVVLAMLSDDAASHAVWVDAGVVAALPVRAVVVESSTISPAWSRELAAAVLDRGVAYVEAPVLGSLPQAEAGQLIAVVGGSEEHLARVAGVLEAMCSRVERIGGVGDGAAMKLAVNAFLAMQAAALAEVLAITRSAGLDQDRVVELLPTLPVTSQTMGRVVTRMHSGQFGSSFPIRLLLKDLGYALDLVAQQQPLTTLEAVRAGYQGAAEAGRADLDFAAIRG